MNYINKENHNLPEEYRFIYDIPDYFLVKSTSPNNRLEYAELASGITFLIPAEAILGSIPESKVELTEEKVNTLYNDEYIRKINDFFNLSHIQERKSSQSPELIKKLDIKN